MAITLSGSITIDESGNLQNATATAGNRRFQIRHQNLLCL
ncbi:hypothetical protein PS726_01615 [Pseudomonas fluorescens]|nr:hypothetical protein PS726_01615 [Pseudomonas fluorescens]